VRSLEVRESAGDPVPRKFRVVATAPIEFWFVPAEVVRVAAADGFLGASEFLATGEVVIGHTSDFGEETHPSGGTAEQVLVHAQAGATLDEGGRFRFIISGHFNDQTGEIDGVRTSHSRTTDASGRAGPTSGRGGPSGFSSPNHCSLS
jgi:hypothetical protein